MTFCWSYVSSCFKLYRFFEPITAHGYTYTFFVPYRDIMFRLTFTGPPVRKVPVRYIRDNLDKKPVLKCLMSNNVVPGYIFTKMTYWYGTCHLNFSFAYRIFCYVKLNGMPVGGIDMLFSYFLTFRLHGASVMHHVEAELEPGKRFIII
jgi:hypothetical protein